MTENTDIQADIAIVLEIASTPEEERIRHYCGLAHERLITSSDLPVLQNICVSGFHVEVGNIYPQCRQRNLPSSIACAHDTKYWSAIRNVLKYLINRTTGNAEEVRAMSNVTEQHFQRLYGASNLDSEMLLVRLPSIRDQAKEYQLLEEHNQMVSDLFRFSDRIDQLIAE